MQKIIFFQNLVKYADTASMTGVKLTRRRHSRSLGPHLVFFHYRRILSP